MVEVLGCGHPLLEGHMLVKLLGVLCEREKGGWTWFDKIRLSPRLNKNRSRDRMITFGERVH